MENLLNSNSKDFQQFNLPPINQKVAKNHQNGSNFTVKLYTKFPKTIH